MIPELLKKIIESLREYPDKIENSVMSKNRKFPIMRQYGTFICPYNYDPDDTTKDLLKVLLQNIVEKEQQIIDQELLNAVPFKTKPCATEIL